MRAELVSCEEAVSTVDECGGVPGPGSEKEHVLVCVRITLRGRPGVLLADPGYHVDRVVTVMADRAYPHTGWFTKSEEPECHKEYHYTFRGNSSYIEWQERETRGLHVKYQTSLIFVARSFLSGVHVTERRNLVYNFKSLLARDQKGQLTAGIYFPVGTVSKDAHFTLFYGIGSERKKIKYLFHTFIDPKNISKHTLEEIDVCNALMKYENGELLKIICQLAVIMSNASFINQMLAINDDICRFSN